MKFYDRYRSRCYALTHLCFLITLTLLIGCMAKTSTPQNAEMMLLSATITDIDDHGNAVTDMLIAPFTQRGWELGDTLEATFETGEKIRIKFVENYGDVPVGEYLGRFSTSTKRFKIAMNRGNIAETLKLKSPSKVVLQKVAPPSKESQAN